MPEQAEAHLCFGGAQNTVSAWLNGQYLGQHEGYSTPFSFAVPAGCIAAGENRITLAVSNHRLAGYMGRPVSGLTSRAANECTGGVYGDVALRFFRDGLRDAWVSTAKDCASFTVHVMGAADQEKSVKIYDGKTLMHEQVIPAGEDSCIVSAKGYRLWHPDRPQMYRAQISAAHEEIAFRFGIRRLTVEGSRLFLNGEPFFFRGGCEHCYQPINVHPTQDKSYYRMVIRKLKELGFNAIRFHTWMPPYAYMEAADELGMVLEVESPIIRPYPNGGKSWPSAAGIPP